PVVGGSTPPQPPSPAAQSVVPSVPAVAPSKTATVSPVSVAEQRAASPAPSAPPVTVRASPSAQRADAVASGQLDAILRRLPSPRAAVVQTLDGSVRASLAEDMEVPSASTMKLPLM